MWKLYKIQLLIMSPLLILTLILIIPIYYIVRIVNKILFKQGYEQLIINQS